MKPQKNHSADRAGYKRENLYSVIVVFIVNGQNGFYKLRNIEADKPAVWNRFEAFVRGKYGDGLSHANLYGGISKRFSRQIDFKKK